MIPEGCELINGKLRLRVDSPDGTFANRPSKPPYSTNGKPRSQAAATPSRPSKQNENATTPKDPTPSEPPDPERIAALADQLQDRLFPSYLYATLKDTLGDKIGPEIIHGYVNKLLSEAGAPRDPIERVLVEQLLLAHQHISILTARSVKNNSAKETALYATAVARLQAEVRRTAIALKDYRLAACGRSLKVMTGDEEAPAESAG